MFIGEYCYLLPFRSYRFPVLERICLSCTYTRKLLSCTYTRISLSCTYQRYLLTREYYSGCSILVGKCPPIFTGDTTLDTLTCIFIRWIKSFPTVLVERNLHQHSHSLNQSNSYLYWWYNTICINIFIRWIKAFSTKGTTTMLWSTMAEKPQKRWRYPPEKTFHSQGTFYY